MRLRRMIGTLAVMIATSIPAAWGQAEIDPDHYDERTTAPVQRANVNTHAETATVRYLGSFRLPYALQCQGEKLRPGMYSLSLRSDGITGQAMLKQNGQAISVRGVVRQPAQTDGKDVIIVEHDGTTRKLVEIQAAKLDLVVDSDLPTPAASRTKVKRIERLPLQATATRTTVR
jgi:hypothetical protein